MASRSVLAIGRSEPMWFELNLDAPWKVCHRSKPVVTGANGLVDITIYPMLASKILFAVGRRP